MGTRDENTHRNRTKGACAGLSASAFSREFMLYCLCARRLFVRSDVSKARPLVPVRSKRCLLFSQFQSDCCVLIQC